jgi:predicted HicB family RNase H-like nuclease
MTEKMEQVAEVKEQSAEVVTKQSGDKAPKEEVKTLTIRLPEALHKQFKEYAKAVKLPMNTLVVQYIKEAVKK